MERAARAVDGRARARPTCWRFPMDELRPGRATDAASPSRAARRRRALPAGRGPAGARRPATPPQDELLLLTTHGILHLLGYDHAEPDEEREMFGLQRTLLLDVPGRREPPGPPTAGGRRR